MNYEFFMMINCEIFRYCTCWRKTKTTGARKFNCRVFQWKLSLYLEFSSVWVWFNMIYISMFLWDDIHNLMRGDGDERCSKEVLKWSNSWYDAGWKPRVQNLATRISQLVIVSFGMLTGRSKFVGCNGEGGGKIPPLGRSDPWMLVISEGIRGTIWIFEGYMCAYPWDWLQKIGWHENPNGIGHGGRCGRVAEDFRTCRDHWWDLPCWLPSKYQLAVNNGRIIEDLPINNGDFH